MPFLLLRVVFTVAFSHLLRLSQARTRRPPVAAAVNYLAAAVACGAWMAFEHGRWHSTAAWLGFAAGLTYVTSLVLMLPSMRTSGVSVTGALLQLSLMLPVGVAIWRFGEIPNRYQTVGILVTLVALPVLSGSSAVSARERRHRFSWLPILLFVSAGIAQVIMKEFSARCPPRDLPLYSTALFISSTIWTLVWIDSERRLGGMGRAPSREGPAPGGPVMGEWALGTVLGMVNVAQLVFLLLALRALPAVVVFPVSAALGIAVNAGASIVFWKERLRPSGWVGLVLAAVAVVLLNLK